ncbi:hypothetical protein [Alkalihalobacterium alkalinitrilicum]|uniref:hypothetical protein n=1 Tax=Alkalihalobacterium alkalinitrilicum TaxID=427920 RepID=UPI0009954DB7|nr:hypothetical protein [Alkalihalobacterium alkalinitrilicum]
MLLNITYSPRNPLVTKPKHIYKAWDKRQRHQEFYNIKNSLSEENQTSYIANIDLYGYGYKTIEEQKSNTLDVRI